MLPAQSAARESWGYCFALLSDIYIFGEMKMGIKILNLPSGKQERPETGLWKSWECSNSNA